jgi:hypothetical protein
MGISYFKGWEDRGASDGSLTAVFKLTEPKTTTEYDYLEHTDKPTEFKSRTVTRDEIVHSLDSLKGILANPEAFKGEPNTRLQMQRAVNTHPNRDGGPV